MSALDQAFIKAYSQQNPALAPAAVETAKMAYTQTTTKLASAVVETAKPSPSASAAAEPVRAVKAPAATKARSKRKSKSPGSLASDSIFDSMKKLDASGKSTGKSGGAKKSNAAKREKKPSSTTAVNPPHAAKMGSADKPKSKSGKTAMPPTTTGTKTPNVSYRLDAPATPIGAAAKVRQSVPAPHANAMHAEAKKPLPRREPAARQGNSPAAEAAPPKDTAKIAEAEAKAAKSFEDITRALSNLDRGNSANAEPEITAKDPFDIFDTLAFGMKQHAPAPVSPPEKKPAPEEAPIPNQFTSPNTSVAVEKKNAATGKGDILDKKSPASANVDSRENKHSYSAKSDAPGQINSYSGKSDTPEKQNPPDKPSVEESQPAPAIRLFQPMLQVDHFAWPKVCGRLEKGANAELDRIIEILIAANARGKKMFALGGCRSGDGATSLLLATARQMAAQGVKAVLVDADWSQPQLARRLGLLPQYGWEDVLAGRLPLEEVLIESVAERLVILPVREPFTASELPADAPNRIAETWESLRRHFDVVLIDSGPLANSPILDQRYVGVLAGRIEAVVMVKNLRRQDDDEFNATQQALNNAAAKVIGVIENFAGG